MKQQIGMNSSKLEEFFAQIRAYEEDGKQSSHLKGSRLQEQIYRAYSPMVAGYSKKYNIRLDEVQGIFDEVFSYVYNNMFNQVIEATDFNPAMRNIMIKKCQEYNNAKKNRYAKPVMTSNEVAKQSYLYTISVLAELNKNAELAKELELTSANIKLLNAFYGINKEGVRYSAEDLAELYGISPVTMRSRLASSLRKIRNRQAFETTKKQNPDFNFGA